MQYIEKVQLPHTGMPFLLYLDNLGVHANDECQAKLLSKNVHCRGLIPGATHLQQPVDLGPGKMVKDSIHGMFVLSLSLSLSLYHLF